MTDPNGKPTALDQIEKEMINEIQALFDKYREKLDEFKNADNGNALSMHSSV